MIYFYSSGVPVSNQWDKKGYFYPIQVAQYGLSHHAKLLDENGASDDRFVFSSILILVIHLVPIL